LTRAVTGIRTGPDRRQGRLRRGRRRCALRRLQPKRSPERSPSIAAADSTTPRAGTSHHNYHRAGRGALAFTSDGGRDLGMGL